MWRRSCGRSPSWSISAIAGSHTLRRKFDDRSGVPESVVNHNSDGRGLARPVRGEHGEGAAPRHIDFDASQHLQLGSFHGPLGVQLTVAGYSGAVVFLRSFSYGVSPASPPWGRLKL